MFIYANSPHSVKAVVGTVDCKNWRSSISLGNTTISFEDDDFRPNFVVDLSPFVKNFLNVILQRNRKTKPLKCLLTFQ